MAFNATTIWNNSVTINRHMYCEIKQLVSDEYYEQHEHREQRFGSNLNFRVCGLAKSESCV